MRTDLQADLESIMHKWIEDNCEDIDTWWGEDAAVLMARAAGAVVDAQTSVCQWLKSEKMID